MTKNDLEAIALIPVVAVICFYNQELADIIGKALHYFFGLLG